MTSRGADRSWQNATHAATISLYPSVFIDNHLSPLFIRRTYGTRPQTNALKHIVSEEEFWREAKTLTFALVQLDRFRLTDWFPRTPGRYWSEFALAAREDAWSRPVSEDPALGEYSFYEPSIKMALIEGGGIGTVRLRPRKIDGEDCWLATAVSGNECQRGIPLVIPHRALPEAGIDWGDTVNLRGQVRFLQDAGLEDTAASVHGARPLIVYVNELEGVVSAGPIEPIFISPIVLFRSDRYESSSNLNRWGFNEDRGLQYTFVQCPADSDSELAAATEWIERYAEKYEGHVVTNFDEQCPILADAPLSYQRLVTGSYDRTVIEHFSGSIKVDSIDHVVQEHGEVHMGHKINVGGSAIINIDSVLSNVTQMIGAVEGLDAAQKSQLVQYVQSLKADLDNLKSTHPSEVELIADALRKAVTQATKPPQERRPGFLELTANGLKEAAALVKDVAPSILATAGLIARFVVGLQ